MNPTRIVPFREVCDANAFKIATSLIMTGIELPGQLAGVQGAMPQRHGGVEGQRPRSKMQTCIPSCLSARADITPLERRIPGFRSFGRL